MTPLILFTAAALLDASSVDLSGNPIAKVTALLTDMRSTLEKEAKTDEDLYDKMSCWCTTNGGNKKDAVATAEKRINALTESISEYAAKSAELKAQMKKLGGEIAKNQDSLAKAQAIRKEENAEFSAEEKELTGSLRSVAGAVDSLKKHHESFLQVDTVSLNGVVQALHRHAASVKPSQRKVLEAFLQQMPSSGSYSSRSGAIYGILEQMKETFESNLSQSEKDEVQAQREFNALAGSKNKEINAAKEATMAKTQQLAETDEALVHAKHDMEKTRAALSADQKFLLDLSERCQAADAEYAQRVESRNTEIAAVGDALSILTEDSARDLFSSTLSFVQKPASAAVRKAQALLQEAGRKHKNTELLALSATVSLDAFTKVTAAINEMVGALKKEQEDEVVHQRFCNKELSKNAAGQETAKDNIEDLTVSLNDMAGTIDTLKTDIANLQSEVGTTNVALKRASEDRAAENAEFQSTVADQRGTEMILQKVLARLGKVYQKSLIQGKAGAWLAKNEPGAAAPPPPAGFKQYKQASGAGSVMQLIQNIADDANALAKEALHAEQTAQSAYESFVKDTADVVNAANRAISAKSSELATLETASVNAGGDKTANMNSLERLNTFAGKLHMSCDYVVNNFEARQTARGEEIDALNQAKAILTGADFGF